MWSLLHGKRLVNGSSGFDPPFTQEVREALAGLPATRVLAEIRTIYPLRFLLVHLDRLRDPEERTAWERLVEAPPPGLPWPAASGTRSPSSSTPAPERSRRWERTFSTDLVVAHPRARVSVALAREDPEIDPSVDVGFQRAPAHAGRAGRASPDLDVPLPPPYPKVDRNVLSLELTYRLSAASASDAPDT